MGRFGGPVVREEVDMDRIEAQEWAPDLDDATKTYITSLVEGMMLLSEARRNDPSRWGTTEMMEHPVFGNVLFM